MFTPSLNYLSQPVEVEDDGTWGTPLFETYEECKEFCDKVIEIERKKIES